jgi:hypothetical protein
MRLTLPLALNPVCYDKKFCADMMIQTTGTNHWRDFSPATDRNFVFLVGAMSGVYRAHNFRQTGLVANTSSIELHSNLAILWVWQYLGAGFE